MCGGVVVQKTQVSLRKLEVAQAPAARRSDAFRLAFRTCAGTIGLLGDVVVLMRNFSERLHGCATRCGKCVGSNLPRKGLQQHVVVMRSIDTIATELGMWPHQI